MLLLLMLPVALPAQDFTYTTNNGAITITGYIGPGGDVVIPDTITGLPVTSIGFYAFYRNASLTNVTMGNSVTSIGSYAFSGCTSLTSLAIPDSVTDISYDAFYRCTSLTSVTIGKSVTGIGANAFSSCTNLTAVNFRGPAPFLSGEVFSGVGATIYYRPGTTGWGETFGGLPTALWVLRAEDLTAGIPEDVALHGLVSGSDPEGEELSFELLTSPEMGQVQFQPSGAFTYSPAHNFNGQDHFTFRALDGQTSSPPATVTIVVWPVNDAPLAEAEVGPLIDWVEEPVVPLILAGNNEGAVVRLDGRGSSDVDGDRLRYYWLEEGATVPLAEGAVVEIFFEIGWQELVLLVDDRQASGTAPVVFEVLTPVSAVELFMLEVYDSTLERQQKQPLITLLKVVAASFEWENWGSGLNQLKAFQNKVRAQVTRINAQLAEDLIEAAQDIIDALNRPPTSATP